MVVDFALDNLSGDQEPLLHQPEQPALCYVPKQFRCDRHTKPLTNFPHQLSNKPIYSSAFKKHPENGVSQSASLILLPRKTTSLLFLCVKWSSSAGIYALCVQLLNLKRLQQGNHSTGLFFMEYVWEETLQLSHTFGTAFMCLQWECKALLHVVSSVR